MQHLKVSGAVRPLKWSLGVKWLSTYRGQKCFIDDDWDSIPYRTMHFFVPSRPESPLLTATDYFLRVEIKLSVYLHLHTVTDCGVCI